VGAWLLATLTTEQREKPAARGRYVAEARAQGLLLGRLGVRCQASWQGVADRALGNLGGECRPRGLADGPCPDALPRDRFYLTLRLRPCGASRRDDSYLVDSASSHMLVSKIKPCMSKYKQLYSETANGSLNQLSFI
jgi:hypothetical protein